MFVNSKSYAQQGKKNPIKQKIDRTNKNSIPPYPLQPTAAIINELKQN